MVAVCLIFGKKCDTIFHYIFDIGGRNMELSYNKELYPKTAVLKAAYNFTDEYYIHIDQDEHNYIVDIIPKEQNAGKNIKNIFDNEILAQSARYHITEQTKNIRELIMSRAFASTVINDQPVESEETVEQVDIDKILTDWFEINEQ